MEKNQLKELMMASDDMAASLQELKQRILNPNDLDLNNFQSEPSEILVEAMKNRTILRTLAQTLQKNRLLLQTNKEKMQRSRTFLQGLQYYKTTLKEKIKSHDIQIENPDEYLDQKLGDINCKSNYEKQQKVVRDQLEKLSNKTQGLKKIKEQRDQLEDKIKQRKKLYRETIPNQIRRLNEEVMETGKLFNIQYQEVFQEIKNKKLASIWDTLKIYQQSCNISIKYSNQPFQSIFITLKACKHPAYPIAVDPKFNLAIDDQKQICLEICCPQPYYNNLVIGIDRHCGFANFVVFNRLVNNEQATALFTQPDNQMQRNLNTKYLTASWIMNLMIAGFLEPFFRVVRNKIAALYVLKGCLSKYKRNTSHTVGKSKLLVKAAAKITFEQYKKLIEMPHQVSTALNQYRIAQISNADKDIEDPSLEMQLSQKYKALETLTIRLHLQELLVPNLNKYYTFELQCNKEQISSVLIVKFVLVVPYQFPHKKAIIKIYSFQRQQLKGKGREEVLWMLQMNDYKTESEKNTYQPQIELIEHQLNNTQNIQNNKKVADLLVSYSKGERNEDYQEVIKIFNTYLSINRLFDFLSKWEP